MSGRFPTVAELRQDYATSPSQVSFEHCEAVINNEVESLMVKELDSDRYCQHECLAHFTDVLLNITINTLLFP